MNMLAMQYLPSRKHHSVFSNQNIYEYIHIAVFFCTLPQKLVMCPGHGELNSNMYLNLYRENALIHIESHRIENLEKKHYTVKVLVHNFAKSLLH